MLALPYAVVSFDAGAYDGVAHRGNRDPGAGAAGVWVTRLLNAALRRATATIPNVITTQEVTGGVILGALLYGEIPGPSAVLGALLALAGVIAVVVFGRSRAQSGSGDG